MDIVLGGFLVKILAMPEKERDLMARGLLFQSMAEVIKRTKPVLFVAENVRGLLTMNSGEAIKTIINYFEKLDYHVVYNCSRSLTTASAKKRKGYYRWNKKDKLPAFEYPKPTLGKKNWISLKQAIGDLERAEEGKVANHYWSKAKKNKGQGKFCCVGE